MVDTMEEALNSFYFVTFIFGLEILRYPLNYPRVRLSIIYILSVSSIYIYVFYYLLTFFLTRIRSFLVYFNMTINLLVTTITIIVTIRKHKKFSILINNLSQVNDTLEELGVPKDYHRMQNSIKWIIIMFFITSFIILSSSYLCISEVFNETVVYSIVLSYSYFNNCLMDIKFMYLLRYIGTRYDKVNDLIKHVSETEEDGQTVRCKCKESILVSRHYIRNTENRKYVLWIAMHLHSQLCRIALDMNGLFEIKMTVQTMSYFVTLTMIFYFQYDMMFCLLYSSSVIQWKCLLIGYLTCVLNLIRFISLNNICESVSAKAQKTERIIHKLTNLICFAEAREEICQFALQISLRPLKFTGMGLFYFGHEFLCKFFIWVFSVIIIVIQMDTSPTYQIVSNRDNVTCHLF